MKDLSDVNNSITLPTFFLLSVFLFLTGTFLSYSHYDESSEFQSAWKEFNKREKVYSELYPQIKEERKSENIRFNRELEDLKTQYNEKLTEAKNIRRIYEKKLSDVKSEYDSNIKTLEAEAKNIISFCGESISTFRRYNLSTRQNHKMPLSFNRDPLVPNNPFSKFEELDPNP